MKLASTDIPVDASIYIPAHNSVTAQKALVDVTSSTGKLRKTFTLMKPLRTPVFRLLVSL
jgi:hypothetical protein